MGSAVSEAGGELVELRGDEALCVFGSARTARLAAVEFQLRVRDRIEDEPALPLGVGIGLDAGEAVPTDGGYRGRALNLAARLCTLAGPGEILATETVATLAGSQPGVGFARRRPVRLKGLAEPVRHVEVVPEVELPPVPTPPAAMPKRRGPLWVRAHRRVLALAAIPVVAAAAVGVAALARSDDSGVVLAPNSVAVIDPKTNRLVAGIGVGDGPTHVAVGDGRVWVINAAAKTLSIIDAKERAHVRTFAPAATPAGLAVGGGYVWIGDSLTRSVLQIEPDTGVVVNTIRAPPLTPPPVRVGQADGGAIAFGHASVWFLSGNTTLSRINPSTHKVVRRFRHIGVSSTSVAVGSDAVWVTGCCEGMTRIDPFTNSRTDTDGVDGPLAVGLEGVWVADVLGNPGHEAVWQFGSRSRRLVSTIPLSSPIDVAVGEGSVWVAQADGVVARIDPSTADVVATIPVRGIPAGIAVGEGAVWVTVG